MHRGLSSDIMVGLGCRKHTNLWLVLGGPLGTNVNDWRHVRVAFVGSTLPRPVCRTLKHWWARADEYSQLTYICTYIAVRVQLQSNLIFFLSTPKTPPLNSTRLQAHSRAPVVARIERPSHTPFLLQEYNHHHHHHHQVDQPFPTTMQLHVLAMPTLTSLLAGLMFMFMFILPSCTATPVPQQQQQTKPQAPIDWAALDAQYDACVAGQIIRGEKLNITKCVREIA